MTDNQPDLSGFRIELFYDSLNYSQINVCYTNNNYLENSPKKIRALIG